MRLYGFKVKMKTCRSDPAEIPPEECACWRLGGVLSGDDEYLLDELDHVSEAAMRRSCITWAREMALRGLAPLLGSGPLPVGNDYVTASVADGAESWPIKLAASVYDLRLVLRQWVEEYPDEDKTFAHQLEGSEPWKEAVLCISALNSPPTRPLFGEKDWRTRFEHRRRVVAHGRLEPDELVRYCSHDLRGRSTSPFETARFILTTFGLPTTPGTIRYLLYQAGVVASECPLPAPTRGLIVTSFILTPTVSRSCWGERCKSFPSKVVSTTACDTNWTTDELRRRAQQVSFRHASWWEAIGIAPPRKVDLRSHNRRQPDALAEMVEQVVAGHMSFEELIKHAVAEAQQAADDHLLPAERIRIRKNLQKRISRARAKSGRSSERPR